MRRFLGLWVLLALALPLSSYAQSQEDEAGDISEVDKDALGPLRERIRPVSGHVFLKTGRFEVSPSAAVSIKDAFFTKYLFGLTAAYHFSEAFSAGLRFNYSLPVISGAAQICTVDSTGLQRTCRGPTDRELTGYAPGKVNMLAGLDLSWAPIYGKLSMTSEAFLHFDMYLLLGPTAVFYTGPRYNATVPVLDAAGLRVTEGKITVGANVGLGFRIFATRWFALRTELRDISYFEQMGDPAGSSWRNQFLFELGFSFFLPTNFQEQ
jgi:outer membrane beta-barrel protein